MTTIVVLSLISFVLLIGCGKKTVVTENSISYSGGVYPENGLPKDKKVTIQAIFPVAGYGKEYFEFAVKTFQERFPNVTIDVHLIEEGNVIYQSRMKSLLQSGNEKEMYDWIYSLGEDDSKYLIESGKLERQDELWERFLYDLPQKKVEDVHLLEERPVTIDGHIYAIPTQSTIYGLYYNKKMFKENGWKEQSKNWEEFLLICEKIKARGISPLVMAGKYPYYFSYGWGAIPHEVGGEEYFNAQYKYAPNLYVSKPYLTMLERMEAFVKKGYLHPGTASFDHTQSQMEFIQGKAALITNATWIANEMREVTSSDFEWGFMPFPGNNPGQKQVILVTSTSQGYIWKNKPELQKKWAKEFNLWLLNLDVQLKFAKSGGVPVRKDLTQNEKRIANVSPSVIAALQSINSEDVRLINDGMREKQIKNVEMAKLAKVKQDGYIALITGRKDASKVAKEINEQYMKGLSLEK